MNEAKKLRLAELEADLQHQQHQLDWKQREIELAREAKELRAESFFRLLLPQWRERVKSWRANMPDPVKHPVWDHLAEAYLRRCEVIIFAIDSRIPNALPEGIWQQKRTLEELMGMPVRADKDELRDLLSEAGFPWDETKALLGTHRKTGPAKGPRKGTNPPMTPKQVIEAYEMYMVGKRTHRQIADHFCPPDCEYREDDKHEVCKEIVRDRIEKLRTALDEMPIKLTP